ncbi:MAG: hypothetical protein KGI50_05975 [Patescibacteria group bacterium]|nr:hypothetical protein [Patescibacteria group bacterium]
MAKQSKDAPSADEKIINEARDRFARCEEKESDFRRLYIEDLKFANADSDNGWQWPDNIAKARKDSNRPALTINKTRQHNLQVINDEKKNKPSIKILPVDDNGDLEIAKVLEGMIRHIEYNSHAETVYDTACVCQVEGGLGYWRIVTDFSHDDSFEQEIFLRRVPDPLLIYLDCDIKSVDGSDARYAFAFEDMSKAEFEARYPGEEAKSVVFNTGSDDDWLGKDRIRVAEYFSKSTKRDTLIAHPEQGAIRLSKIEDEAQAKAFMADKSIRKREIEEPEITWYLIAGDKIIDRKPWLGRYIPIVRIIGEELIIDGKFERKGHTRNMKDAQRMYNYMSTANVEYIALQTKTPFIAPVESIEGYEEEWTRANQDNLPYLPYNQYDEQGRPVDKPQREQPPVGASAYLQGMQTAQQELMMSSGQYQEQFGQQSNAIAGVAIQARQRQGDTATYHFIDNQATAIRFTGRILVDLIPKIYDTKRVIRILGEDGSETFATLDPDMQQAKMKEQQQESEDVRMIFNPSIGRYDVTVEVGANFETRRQEEFNALTQIISSSPELMDKIGDLLFKAADFPGAEDIAERLHRLVPPQLLNDDQSPQQQDMTQKMQHMGEMIQQQAQQIQQMQHDRVQMELNIKAYDAETNRIKALAPVDPALVAHLATETIMQMDQTGAPIQPNMQQPTNQPSAGFSLPNQQ